MKKEEAKEFFKTGKLEKEPTVPESIMLETGACLEDDGNVWCCFCDQPNECCSCGMEEDQM